MAKDLFNNLDLNLLRTFLVLSQELNMRKASERLFVSQPAISQSLQKLRHHFDDPLFVKVKTGLEPSDFALSLATKITPHFDALSTALNSTKSFSAKGIDFKLKIALYPVVLSCLSGALYRAIKEQAPNAQLELVSWSSTSPEDIQKGKILIGVSYDIDNISKLVYTKKLVDLTGRVFVRKGHPLNKLCVVPQDLAGYGIASMVTPGWNDNFSYSSQLLTQYNVEHHIEFRSELVMPLIDVIQHSDMYFPHSNLLSIDNFPNLRGIDILIDNAPIKHPVYSYIHIKNRNSALIDWLHTVIEKVLQEQVNK